MTQWHQTERARELLSKEVGYVRKPHGGRLRVALAFPNTYFVGMSNLGFQTVYRLFNAEPDIVCERVFLPPKSELAEQVASGARLVTIESQTAVSEFDVLAFSVSFEWDYTNVLTLLRLAGIPLRAEARTDRHPLIVIGGAVTFVNPEPLALFADVIAAGEGESLVPSLLGAFQGASDRRDLLRRLALERGFYVPSFYQVQYESDGTIQAFVPEAGTGAPPVVRKAALRTTEAVDPPATSIFTPETEFGSRFLVEVVRGCANLCRFCWAGYNYLPVRAFPTARILELAERARPYSSRAGLVSIALCDHPEIEEILTRLAGMGYSISPASLRLDDLTPTIVGRRLELAGDGLLPPAGDRDRAADGELLDLLGCDHHRGRHVVHRGGEEQQRHVPVVAGAVDLTHRLERELLVVQVLAHGHRRGGDLRRRPALLHVGQRRQVRVEGDVVVGALHLAEPHGERRDVGAMGGGHDDVGRDQGAGADHRGDVLGTAAVRGEVDGGVDQDGERRR